MGEVDLEPRTEQVLVREGKAEGQEELKREQVSVSVGGLEEEAADKGISTTGNGIKGILHLSFQALIKQTQWG